MGAEFWIGLAGTVAAAFAGAWGSVQVALWRIGALEKRADKNDEVHESMCKKISDHETRITLLEKSPH